VGKERRITDRSKEAEREGACCETGLEVPEDEAMSRSVGKREREERSRSSEDDVLGSQPFSSSSLIFRTHSLPVMYR